MSVANFKIIKMARTQPAFHFCHTVAILENGIDGIAPHHTKEDISHHPLTHQCSVPLPALSVTVTDIMNQSGLSFPVK